MSRSFFVCAVLLSVSVAACADLPPLDVCGNALVDEKEDCDGTDGKAADGSTVRCGSPGEARACRFTCDVHDKEHPGACPTGYVCSGSDGICRAPSGDYREIARSDGSARRLMIGDIDGDGLNDLLAAHDPVGASVSFSSPNGGQATAELPSLDYAALGSITQLGTLDAVSWFSSPESGIAGMIVLEGAGRSFAPASFSSFPVDDGVYALPYYLASVGGLLALRGDDLVAFASDFAAPHKVKGLGGYPHPAIGEVATFSPDAMLGVSFGGRVVIIDPADLGSAATAKRQATITVPAGAGHIHRFWVRDINGDGSPDVAFSTACDGEPKPCSAGLFAVYSDAVMGQPGPPLFHVTADPSPKETIEAETLGWTPSQQDVLEIVDVNGDGLPDIVTSVGIFNGACAAGGPPCQHEFESLPRLEFTSSPDSAIVTDFNDDGRPDVLVGSSFAPNVTVLLNAGANVYDLSTIETVGGVSHFVVGDFDGDLFPDIAFSDDLGNNSSQIDLLFGARAAEPTGPLVNGPLPGVDQLLAYPDLAGGMSLTERCDLLAVTGPKQKRTLAVFPGSPTREFFSPYFFEPGHSGAVPETPYAAAVGTFDSGDPRQDLAVLTGNASLWLLTSSEQGLAPKQVIDGKDWVASASALLTLPTREPGGLDALVLVGRTSIGVARDTGGAFSIESQLPVPGMVSMTGGSLSAEGCTETGSCGFESPTFPACVGDIDGDARTDLALIVVDSKGRASIRVFWGQDGAGPTLGPSTDITPEGSDLPTSLSCIRAHPTAGVDLAVATSSSVHILSCSGDRVCGYDAGSVLDLGAVVFRPGGAHPVTLQLSPIDSMVAGDLTGDGLQDLVVAGIIDGSARTVILAANPTLQ